MNTQDATTKPASPRKRFREMTTAEVRAHFEPILGVLMRNANTDPWDPLCMARLVAETLQLTRQRSVTHALARQLFAIARARPIVHSLFVAAGVKLKLARIP